MMFFSVNETAEIFDVDRGTVLGWSRRGCPWIDPEGPGRPAQLSFKEVLTWRKSRLASRDGPLISSTTWRSRHALD